MDRRRRVKNDTQNSIGGEQAEAIAWSVRSARHLKWNDDDSPASWRANDFLRQTAILDTLPAHVALIDGEGVIVTVNRAWCDFGDANDLQSTNHGVGLNYLSVLDAAQAEARSDAEQIAAGIRGVLSGERSLYSVEYPCHSPAEKRWFLLTATAITDRKRVGAVVMHVNITERRLTEETLLRSHTRLALASESGHIGIWEWDVVKNRLEWDAQMFALYGLESGSFSGAYEAWLQGVHPDDRAAGDEAIRAALSGEKPFDVEFRVIWPGGEIHHIEAHALVQRAADGSATNMIGVNWDITSRKAAEALIIRQNRAHQLLSGISNLIVRGQNRDQLFVDACRMLIEGNAFRMVVIAVPDPQAERLVPVAWAGVDDALMDRLRSTLRAPLDPGSATARAMADKSACVSEDLNREPFLRLADHQGACEVRSMAAVPLMASDQVLGVMNFYSGDKDAFAAEELKLLATLADDLAFATDHLEKQERLSYVTYHDALTGLPNRRLFLEHASEHIRRVTAGDRNVAVCLFDLARFSQLNASSGLAAGDTLLRQVGSYLSKALGDKTLVARVGADQFAFLIPETDGAESAGEVLAKLTETFIADTFPLNGEVLHIGARAGVALFPNDGDNAETLFKHATVALSHAKAGGQRVLFYTSTMTDSLIGRLTLERRLLDALNRGEFVLHYQPKTTLATGAVNSAEALIRWQDPLRGLVPPAQFIPMLEETGLIHAVGRWALKQAVTDARRWRARGLTSLRLAVNVSSQQMRKRDFFDDIDAMLAADAEIAHCLELEITEGVLMEDARHSIERLKTLRAAGVTVAIDDFGTGYSSLSYLTKLPVDTLKIDRSFVLDMTTGPQGLALVSTIVHLANALNLKVVAEGVETKEQARLLRLLGCQEIQGFLVSGAVSADDFEARYIRDPIALDSGIHKLQ